MPQLKSTEQLKKIYLPSTSGETEENKAWVVMDVSPQKAGDMLSFDTMMTQGRMGFMLVLGRLREWNYTDAQNATLPITEETLGYVAIPDFDFLRAQMETEEVELDTEAKKDSPSTSPQSETGTPPA